MVSLEGDRLLIEGPIVMQNVNAVRAAADAHFARGAVASLDLSRVSDIDSSAVALLLGWLRAAAKAGKTLTLSGLPPAFSTLVDLYGVGAFFEKP
jgi:phospholipid transport system transporter-binding protein